VAWEAVEPDVRAIVECALEVHRELGPGFLEAAYARALVLELGARGIPWRSEVLLPIHYKGLQLGVPMRVDLMCGDLVVELKARSWMGRAEERQVLQYLRASGLRRGLLLNFGAPALRWERIEAGPLEERAPSSAGAMA